MNSDDFQKMISPLRESQARFWKGLLDEAVEAGYLKKKTDEDMSMLAFILSGIIRGSYMELFFYSGAACPDKEVIAKWNALLMEIIFEGVFKQTE